MGINLKNKRVLFIDLDSTLIHTILGKTFPEDISDFRIDLKVLDKIVKVFSNLESLFIVTNQSGIERGYVTEKDFRTKIKAIWAFVYSYLFKRIRYIQDIDFRYCTSSDKSNPNRKPNTGMLEYLIMSHYIDIPKEEMVMIGDASGKPGDWSDSDRKTAENFGIDYIDVRDFLNM